VTFQVVVPEVEELEAGPPHEVALENALRKARAVAQERPHAIVLGVDTIVALGSKLYGKPKDRDQAERTLRALSGRSHTVISGVCLISDGDVRTAAATTIVSFRALGDELVSWYLDSGEWRERAGGYAIQGRGAALVAGIEGDHSNVVGLPVPTVLDMIDLTARS
jgi:septum formation protein